MQPPFTPRRHLPPLVAAALALCSPVLQAQVAGVEAELQRCAGISEATPRLACYDRLARRPASATAPAAAPATSATPAAAVAAAPPASPTARFGLTDSARGEAQAIESSVPASFRGWGPNQRIRLENGQVWQVMDGSDAALTPGARKVWVRKGMLGSFILEVEGSNRTARVKRVE